jgi:hypothetical protein
MCGAKLVRADRRAPDDLGDERRSPSPVGSPLTPLGVPDWLATALDLSPNIISRLVAIKSLLDLGDLELVAVASSRLESERAEPEIDGVLSALEEHRYSEAAELIGKLLSDGTRIARWIDPEIALLEAELEQLTAELADLETEQAELEHLLSRFQAAHNEALGDRIASLLKLRMRMLGRQLKTNSAKRPAYEQARRDFEDFQQDQEHQKETDARTKWELSEAEQAELKRLFRKGSKLCHPDLMPPEHHDAAAAMFRELRKAYDEGNLERVRQLVKRGEAGLFEDQSGAGDSDNRIKERLKARIVGIREALERTRGSIQEIKRSATYRTMTESADWLALFEKQAEVLDLEIESLSETLGGMADDDA